MCKSKLLLFIVSEYINPCSAENINLGRMHHPYPADRTKFIQCNEWGNSFVRQCAAREVWSQYYDTCVDVEPGDYAHTGYTEIDVSDNNAQWQPPSDYPPQVHYYEADRPVNIDNYQSKNSNSQPINANSYPQNGLLRYIVLAASGEESQPRDSYIGANSKSYTGGHVNPYVLVANSANKQLNAHQYNVNGDSNNMWTLESLCKNGHVRYLPAQSTDIHHFFECQSGQATQQTCPGEEVWIQPLRQCARLHNSPAQAQPSHNPCVGSDTRFHPYPGNPSKYIECQTWQQVYVWACGTHQLWAQQLQACIDVSKLTPIHIISEPAPTPAPMPKPKPNPRPRPVPTLAPKSNPCGNRRKPFYHAYAPDKTKFIQCDEFGNMYVRRCSYKHIWDDYYKVCVGFNNATNRGGTGSAGAVVQESEAEAKARGEALEIAFMEGKRGGRAIRRSGSIPLTATRTICPDGYTHDQSLHMCVRKDDSGPNCSPQDQWDDYLHMCVPTDDNQDFNTVQIEQPVGVKYKYEYDYDYDAADGGETAPVDAREAESIPEIKVYDGKNPCGLRDDAGEHFYFEFPLDNQYYIQCDQNGQMYIQPCDRGEVWNQKILTCVPNLGLLSGSSSNSDVTDSTGEGTDGEGVIDSSNPCITSELTYHSDPINQQSFLVCVHQTPYPFYCPDGSKWDDIMQTCDFAGQNGSPTRK